MDEQSTLKPIKLLQERSNLIQRKHSEINGKMDSINDDLTKLIESAKKSNKCDPLKNTSSMENSKIATDQNRKETNIDEIFAEANSKYHTKLGIDDILSNDDKVQIEENLKIYKLEFSKKYELDDWDYLISIGCGLIGGLIDLYCVSPPSNPISTPWNGEIKGFFNQIVQKVFNSAIPKEFSDMLSKTSKIGAPDSSSMSKLKGKPSIIIRPKNHRLLSLAHDPILWFIFGVKDMLNNTCTMVQKGKIKIFKSKMKYENSNFFYNFGRMFCHLLSDINAPSKNNNKGMGLPAPLMGIIRMFETIQIKEINLGQKIEEMYEQGYDFRHYITTKIPMSIMEILLRSSYTIKQMYCYEEEYGETILSTMPMKLCENPKFRMMLALSYGTAGAVNAGRVAITKNPLNINYATWLKLSLHGFHSIKWQILDKHLYFWNGFSEIQVKELEDTCKKIDKLYLRSLNLIK